MEQDLFLTYHPIYLLTYISEQTEMLGFRYQISITIVVALATLSVAQRGCPESYGVQTYPDEKYCDRFYKVRSKCIIIIYQLHETTPQFFRNFNYLFVMFKSYSVQMELWLKKCAKMV